MIKYLALMAVTFVLVLSQRPPYAGSGNRYPAVLPQYITPEQQQNTISSINNRININEENTSSEPSFPIDLPIEAGGDINLINKIKTWPRENWPFWYLNWRQLDEHRGKSSAY
ncbi:hypothetical protein PV328_010867 [Microctonus aethiopoides]|uniref:Uncharacterized protein n=1 Tax=Microctonus aethiopoides TaxID=144406 RepID=A0AA39KQR2_9HYME|nr:hypothetical protein PV328_010867 [Microctonus aethiopoides]